MKILHCSDIHIRPLSRHEEYRNVFSSFYELAQKEQPDIIINTGDTAHNKTNISPEYVELCSEFFKNLSKIAPLYIILGNHDKLRTENRLDAVTPIVNNLNDSKITLWKDCGIYPVNNVNFHVLSFFDRDNWPKVSADKQKINIALYHGAISGCQTDAEWVMEHGEDSINIFDGYDFCLLGDIHKRQFLNDKKTIAYAGSLIQQNFGETDDKGFLVWDIKSRDDFSVRSVVIKNPSPFITVELDKKGIVKEQSNIPPGSRVRVLTKYNLSSEAVRKAVDVVNTKYLPESIVFQDSSNKIDSGINKTQKIYDIEDVRSPKVQERLIAKYLKDYTVSDSTLKQIYDLNKYYNNVLIEKDNAARNVFFEFKRFEWDNLFNYGTNNVIDFDKLKGIVGIFGKNFSGKSSIVDGLLYTLYNSITKNSRKKTKIINKSRDYGSGYLVLGCNNNIFKIKRTSEKYIKKLKGTETVEAKTNLEFESESVDGTTNILNGIDRIDTDKIIAEYFGSYDDFLLTSLSSQLGSLSYIDKGSTERKEILAKFLDVHFFSAKHDLANKDCSDLKAIIKKLDGQNFDKEIADNEVSLFKNDTKLKNSEESLLELKDHLSSLDKDIFLLEKEASQNEEQYIDIDEVLFCVEQKKSLLSKRKEEISFLNGKLNDSVEKLRKLEDFFNTFDVEQLVDKQKIAVNKQKQLHLLHNEIVLNEKDLQNESKKLSILNEVPCGPEFSHCKFIKNAYEAKEKIDLVKIILDSKNKEKGELENDLLSLNFDDLNDKISKFNSLKEKKKSITKDLNVFNSQIEAKTENIKIIELEIQDLTHKEQTYNQNKEKIQKLQQIIEQLEELKMKRGSLTSEIRILEKEIRDLYKNNGVFEQRIEKLKQDKEEYQNICQKYESYELFLKCMHPSGISYDIIKSTLPVINDEISKILSNIVNFQIYFENEDGNRLEIYIKEQGDNEPLPIEMGSGAQKNIAAMAIRLAFIKISSLPKSDIFILDEPGTSFDQDNMEGFIRVLNIIKKQFKCVLLITHLDSLKDIVDNVIIIDRKDGYAHVNV